MSMERCSPSRVCRSPIPRRAAVTLVALAWSSFAFSGEVFQADKGEYISIVVTVVPSDGHKDDLYPTQIQLGVNRIEFDDYGKATLVLGVNPKIIRLFGGEFKVTSTEKLVGTNGIIEFSLDGGHTLRLPIGSSRTCRINNADFLLTPQPKRAQIHDAAKAGDLAKVKALLKEDPDLVSTKDSNGETPLHTAAVSGHKDVVELLLAKAEVKNIYDAAAIGDLEKVKAFLKMHPDLVFSRENNGNSALHEAADGGNKEVAELLLANKAEVNAKGSHGDTPLHLAAKMRDKEMTRFLLANGADVNAKDDQGATPLYYAAFGGRKDVAELLLANKAQVNARDNKGNTPLHYAASNGHEEVAELLRQHGADAGGNSADEAKPATGARAVPGVGAATTSQDAARPKAKLGRGGQRQQDQESGVGHPANEVSQTDKNGAPPTNWPRYSQDLKGLLEVRIKNPNDFKARVGLRSTGNGKDLIVPPNGTGSVSVPNGHYDIYFNYSTDPRGLYQGDSFTLENNGVEITITKVVNGNYGIRKVK